MICYNDQLFHEQDNCSVLKQERHILDGGTCEEHRVLRYQSDVDFIPSISL